MDSKVKPVLLNLFPDFFLFFDMYTIPIHQHIEYRLVIYSYFCRIFV